MEDGQTQGGTGQQALRTGQEMQGEPDSKGWGGGRSLSEHRAEWGWGLGNNGEAFPSHSLGAAGEKPGGETGERRVNTRL